LFSGTLFLSNAPKGHVPAMLAISFFCVSLLMLSFKVKEGTLDCQGKKEQMGKKNKLKQNKTSIVQRLVW